MIANKKIVLVDDDRYLMSPFVEALRDRGFEVLTAGTLSEGKKLLDENSDANAVIVDIMMPVGNDSDFDTDFSTEMGFKSGLVLARWVKRHQPNISIIGMSAGYQPDIIEWFKKLGSGFLHKADYLPDEFAEAIDNIVSGNQFKRLKTFIVHGQDEVTKYKLKNYLQNTLKMPEPIILHEQPSLGRTIIEKFEEETRNIDLVFILLTPDDAVSNSSTSNDVKRRARQNVIFEMGYFYGKLQRKKGRVILLYKGQLELPSDIAGVIYIDITNGIEAAGEDIRRELEAII